MTVTKTPGFETKIENYPGLNYHDIPVIKHYIPDEDGNAKEVSYEEWTAFMLEEYTRSAAGAKPEQLKRHVCRTEIPGGGLVSTVFLSHDHAFNGGPPVLWETMVFDLPEYGENQVRYTSRQHAITGHDEVVVDIFTKRALKAMEW